MQTASDAKREYQLLMDLAKENNWLVPMSPEAASIPDAWVEYWKQCKARSENPDIPLPVEPQTPGKRVCQAPVCNEDLDSDENSRLQPNKNVPFCMTHYRRIPYRISRNLIDCYQERHPDLFQQALDDAFRVLRELHAQDMRPTQSPHRKQR